MKKNVKNRLGVIKWRLFFCALSRKTSDYYNPSVLSILNKSLRFIDSEDIGGTNEKSLQRKWLHREHLWISYGSRKL